MGKKFFLSLLLLLWMPRLALAQVATPVFIPNDADGAVAFDVAVTCATQGAIIYYTTDGVDPTQASAPLPGNGKVHIARHLTLKARAYLSGAPSAVVTSYFRVTGEIYGGANHAMMLKSNGTVWSWGYQESGRLGNGISTATDQVTPQAVSKTGSIPFNDAIAVSAAYMGAYVSDGSGRLWAFGNNSSGTLGDGTLTDQSLARRVLKTNLSPYDANAAETNFLGNSNDGMVTAVAGWYKHAIAIEAGKVWGWGERASGRIGDNYTGSTSIRKWATQVLYDADPTAGVNLQQLSGATQVAAGKSFSMALCPDVNDTQARGQVWTWGSNANGELCQNSTSPSVSGIAIKAKASATADLNDVVQIAAGYNHAVVIRRDNAGVQTAWCWGERLAGRLGDNGPTTTANVTSPVKVQKIAPDGDIGAGTLSDLTGVIQVSAGPRHTLAVTEDGRVWAWGNDGDYQRGDGDHGTLNRSTAKVVRKSDGTILTGIVCVVASGYETYNTDGTIATVNSYSLALHENGTIYGWGYNDHGQVANGATSGTVQTATSSPFTVKASNQAPVVTSLTASTSGTLPLVQPATLTLSGTVTDADGNISQLQFYNNGMTLGSPLTALPWTTTFPNVTAGTYQLSAIATDSVGATGFLAANPTTLTIAAPTVTLSTPTATVSETSATPAKFRFTLNKVQVSDLALAYSVNAASTATAALDYQALSGTVTIPAGASYAEVPVVPLTDFEDEATETVKLNFLSSAGYQAAVTSDTVSITNVSNPNLVKPSTGNGDNQTGPANAFLTAPFEVEVRDYDTNVLLANRTVTFTVLSGNGTLGASSGGATAATQQITSDTNGLAKAWFRQPTQGNFESTIQASIPGRAPVVFKATTNALVGYWKLDEPSGTVAHDSSGSLNDAGLDGISTWSKGYNWTSGASTGGVAIQKTLFNGETGLGISNSNNRIIPATGQPFSIAMWFRANSLPTDDKQYALFSNDAYQQSGMRAGIGKGSTPSKGSLSFWSTESGGTVGISLADSISPNRWYHLAVTYSGSTAKLYLDGVLVGTSTGTIISNTTRPVSFGAGIGGHYSLDGSLDDVYVYHKELTGAEVIGLRDSLTDGDMLPDAWERANFGDLSQTPEGDPDNDGLNNLAEYNIGTNPNVADTDGDGIPDGVEVNQTHTNPLLADTDGDGMPDGWEYDNGTNFLVDDATADPDGDGVNNLAEYQNGSNPHTPTLAKPSEESGDNQIAPANVWLPKPFVVEVRDDGGNLAPGRPVLFTVQSGNGGLSAENGGAVTTALTVASDGQGKAKAWFHQPTQGCFISVIQATIPQRSPIVFTANTYDLVARYALDDATLATTVADSSGTGYFAYQRSGVLSSDRVEGSGSLQLPAATYDYRGFRVQNTGNRLIPDDASKPFTITMWLKTPQIAPGNTYALASNETYLTNGFRLAIDTGRGFSSTYWPGDKDQMRVCFWSGQSGGTLGLIPRRSITANEWHHVAVSYTGTGGALYLDGELIAQEDGIILPNTNDIFFGWGIGGLEGFNGSMDDIRIYARALSQAEVKQMIPATGSLVDSDNDQIPDAWESRFGLNPADSVDGSQDTDGDGVSSLNEYLNGTHPMEKFDLVGHYPLDDAANTWDYPNNVIVQETSGFGWNGQWKAAGSSADRCQGSASFEFAPGNGYQAFKIPNALSKVLPAQGTNPFSMAIWVKPGELAAGQKAAIATNQVDGQSGFRLMTEGVAGGLRVLFSTTGLGGTLELQSQAISPNEWHHLAIAYDGAVGRLYLDGQLASQATGTITHNQGDIVFAAEISGVAGAYSGLMDDLRFYARSFTGPEDVQALMIVDADGDGIDDGTKIANDSDGDGVSDSDELAAGTDPFRKDNPKVHLQVFGFTAP